MAGGQRRSRRESHISSNSEQQLKHLRFPDLDRGNSRATSSERLGPAATAPLELSVDVNRRGFNIQFKGVKDLQRNDVVSHLPTSSIDRASVDCLGLACAFCPR
jgi:hypothetical protein